MKKQVVRSLLALGLQIGLYQFSLAQSQSIQFERIGLEQGLSQMDVHYIMQDHKGYMWFATTDGLNKYDGYSFKSYKYDPTDSTSLGQSTSLMLYEDKEGMIWVGHLGQGISRFNPYTEKFTRYLPNQADAYSLHDGVVPAFSEDDEGGLWVGTARINELRRLDTKTGRFYQTGYKPPGYTGGDAIHTIHRDKSGTYWIASSLGLHTAQFIAARGKQPAQINFSYNPLAERYPNLFKNVDVVCIFEDAANILWFSIAGKGIISYNQKTGAIRQYKYDPNDPNSLSNDHSSKGSIAEDQQGNLWIGTRRGGLNKLNRDRTQIERYTHSLKNLTSLGSDDIISVMVDRSNILWVGTVGGGISKFDPNKRSFSLYHHLPQNPYSLAPEGIRALYEDKSGRVWVGTEGGGLDQLNKKTNRFTHLRLQLTEPKVEASDFVTAFLKDQDDNFWIGTHGGLFKRNWQTLSFEPYFTGAVHYLRNKHDNIYTLFEDHSGLIWLGTTNGIKSLDPRTGAIVAYPCELNNPESLSDFWAYAINEDRKHNIWVGTYKGLNYLDRKTGKFRHYMHRDGDPRSISSSTIRCLFYDDNGTLWIGTLGGGLCRYDEKTNSFHTFTEKDGLANNTVYSIQQDQAGNLWLATNKGLSQFSPTIQTFINYDISDGLQSDQFASGYLNTCSSFKGKNGLLYFGGIKGFNIIDPARIQRNRRVPEIVITQVRLFDQPLPGKAEAAQIDLNYDENFFSFEFAALNYTNTQKNRYAYKLEGIDPQWVYSGFRRYASYTSLDPGTYTFRVKGSNNDGLWNQKGTSITLVIHPPWWQTTWFRLTLAIVLLLSAGVSIWYYTQTKLHRQRIELKNVLQAQEEERQRLAADLHDDLGATLSTIKGQLETVPQATNELVRPISLMEKAIRDLRHISYNLMPPEFAKLGLSEAIQETIRQAQAGTSLDLQFITFGQERRLDHQAELTLYRIAIELINNAIKHAKAQHITIQLIFYPDYVSLLVEDDGRGYPALERSGQDGLGLRNIRSRVGYLQSKLFVDSGERGTTITLEVPL